MGNLNQQEGVAGRKLPAKAVILDGVTGKLAIAGLLVLAICILATYGVTVLKLTKAVPAADSPEIATAYNAYPYLMPLGAAAGVLAMLCSFVAAFKASRRKVRGEVAVLVAAGVAALAGASALIHGTLTSASLGSLQVAGTVKIDEADVVQLNASWWISLIGLVASTALWVGRGWWMLSRQLDNDGAQCNLAGSLQQTPCRQVVAHLPSVGLAAFIACVAIAVPITTLTMWGMPGSNSGASIQILTLCYVASFGLLVAMALQLLRWAWLSIFDASRNNGRAMVAIGAFSGAVAALVGWTAISMAFGSELKTQKLDSLFQIALLIAGMLYGVGVSKNLMRLSKQGHPKSYGELSRLSILAGALTPVMPVMKLMGSVKYNRGTRIVGGLVLCVLIFLLAGPFMKTGSVLFKKVNDTVAFLIVILAILLGQMVLPPNARRPRRKWILMGLAGVLAYGVSATSGMLMSEARANLNTFSPLGKTCKLIMEHVMPPEPGAGKSLPTELSTPDTTRYPELDVLKEKKPLMVLIIWDACRPDHMGIYGYDRPDLEGGTTPNLSRRKNELLRFTNCYSQATGTSCSMRHIYTGRFSSRWMLRSKGNDPFFTNDLLANGYDAMFLNIIGSDYNGISLDAFTRDMPTNLRDRMTCLQCNDCPEDVRRKLVEKESEYKTDYSELQRADPERLKELKDGIKLIECNRQDESKAVGDLLDFLETRKDTKGSGVYAYIHMDATHWPWKGFPGHNSLGEEHVDRYDAAVRYSDEITGQLIDGLEKLGMWDNTILTVVADHGTGLGEHRDFGGFHPWYEQIHVPMVMHVPGVKGREIDSMVALFDLAPTLANVVDEKALPKYESYSLWPTIFGNRKWKDRVIFGLNSFDEDYFLITDDGLHYIREKRLGDHSLFNWKEDRLERHNIWGRDFDARTRTRSLMNWFLKDNSRGRHYTDPDHYSPPPGE